MNTPNANEVGEITNEEEALAAVREHGAALVAVPENLKTAEVCMAAVKKNSEALRFVPKELRKEVRRRVKRGE